MENLLSSARSSQSAAPRTCSKSEQRCATKTMRRTTVKNNSLFQQASVAKDRSQEKGYHDVKLWYKYHMHSRVHPGY